MTDQKLALYYYNAESRHGCLNGLFIAPIGIPERMAAAGLEVYWGEVLGKHSEVIDVLDQYSFGIETDDQPLIQQMLEKIGMIEHPGWTNVFSVHGYTPFEKVEYTDLTEAEQDSE